jgi:hypothetical protein
MKDEPGGFMMDGRLISRLDLSQDLGLPNHHGVQAGGNPENVLYRLISSMNVEAVLKFFQGKMMELGKKTLEVINGLFGFLGKGIDLYSIAGREDHIFLQGRKGLRVAEGPLEVLRLEGQAFPDLDGRCFMV